MQDTFDCASPSARATIGYLVYKDCIQDTLSSRARLASRMHRPRPSARASKGILHTRIALGLESE